MTTELARTVVPAIQGGLDDVLKTSWEICLPTTAQQMQYRPERRLGNVYRPCFPPSEEQAAHATTGHIKGTLKDFI